MTYIIAGNYQQFVRWCSENVLNPKDRSLFYIMDAYKLRGRRWREDDAVVYIGTYYERSDIFEIEEEIKVLQARNIH
jgi:hypothetical protein